LVFLLLYSDLTKWGKCKFYWTFNKIQTADIMEFSERTCDVVLYI